MPDATSLELLARAHFPGPPMSEAEIRLVRSAPIGEIAICGPNAEDSDPANFPRDANKWGEERQIRTEIIRWLCRNASARDLVDPKGIQIYGAKLVGRLDLSQVRVPFPLVLIRCRVPGEMMLRAIEIPQLAFDGSWVGAVKADGADIKGGVTLRNGFRAEQQVRFHRARIGVDLDCGGAAFINPPNKGVEGGGIALAADGATFGGGVFLNKHFHAEGEVRFPRAHIRGDLDCSGATIHNRLAQMGAGSGTAFNGDGVNVGGSIFLRGAQVEGEVRVPRVKVGADIDCMGASITNPILWGPAGSAAAITMEGSSIGGSVILNNQFRASGFVTLRGAQIAGQLDCNGATFENAAPARAPVSMPAFDASLATVASGVFLGRQFRAEGEVVLQSVRIGAALECNGGTFNNPPRVGVGASGRALTADAMKVNGRVALGQGFLAEGEVFLIGAQIEGDLDCGGGKFNSPSTGSTTIGGHALSVHGATINGNVYVRSGFSSTGEVSFQGSSIVGNLEGTSADFQGELNLESTTIKGALVLADVLNPNNLHLTLTNSSVGVMADQKSGWPKPGNLRVDGFVYGRFLGGAPIDSTSRLDWLARQDEFKPQPYHQLAKVLRDEEDGNGAQRVLFRMERLRRKQTDSNWIARALSFLFRITVGYGFYPIPAALGWLLVLTVLGFALFWCGYKGGSIVPTDKEAYTAFKTNRLPAYYEHFHALTYSLENSFQLVKFGQADHWQPDPSPVSSAVAGQEWFHRVLGLFISAGFLRRYRWLQIIFGWFFTAMAVGGVAGIVRKN